MHRIVLATKFKQQPVRTEWLCVRRDGSSTTALGCAPRAAGGSRGATLHNDNGRDGVEVVE